MHAPHLSQEVKSLIPGNYAVVGADQIKYVQRTTEVKDNQKKKVPEGFFKIVNQKEI
jgi:hypothetical protein